MENRLPKGITEIIHFLSVLFPGSLAEAGFLYNITLLCEHRHLPHPISPASHSSSLLPIMWSTPRPHPHPRPGTVGTHRELLRAFFHEECEKRGVEVRKVKGENEISLLFSPYLGNIWSQLGGENWAKLVSPKWNRKFQESPISPLRCTGPGPAGCLQRATGHLHGVIWGTTWAPPVSKYPAPLWSFLQERRGPKRTLFQYKYVFWEKQSRLFINALRVGCALNTHILSTSYMPDIMWGAGLQAWSTVVLAVRSLRLVRGSEREEAI